MAWLVSVVGLILAMAGAASLANGIGYIRLDWGATEVLAGTSALSGGVVTLALAAVLFALRDLADPFRSRSDRAAAPTSGSGDNLPTASRRGLGGAGRRAGRAGGHRPLLDL